MSIDYELPRESNDSRQRRYIETVQIKERNPSFMASPAGYHSIHQWLKRNFGNPRSCEECGVLGYKEKGGRWSIQFALRKGFSHTHNREAYIGLCRHCHGIYDWDESKTINMIAAARNQKGTHSAAKSLIAHSRRRDQNGHFIMV